MPSPGRRLCVAFAVLAGTWTSTARAADPPAVEFDPGFLIGRSGRGVDLRRFSSGNAMPAGTYRTDVVFNERILGTFDIRLEIDASGRQNLVCMDDALVRRLGLDASKASEAIQRVLLGPARETESAAPTGCRPIGDVAAGGVARFDTTEQRLELSIPQIYLVRSARGYVPPERWDSGITAGLLSYRYSDFDVSSASSSTTQRFLGLRAGFNLGDYRLRHDGSYTSGFDGRKYQAIATHVQRAVPEWLSTLTLGDGHTDGQLFDSFGFRGVQLASDDQMLPDSLRGYAPVVRGEARTNARVSIRQNGVVLYETVVPPGPFAIGDMYAVGAGSDLQVTITEADGTQRVTAVPYASMPQLLRENAHRYAITLGTPRQGGGATDALLLQGTYQRGLTNWLTAQAGLQMTPRFAAVLVGGAVVTPVGAIALDATVSRFDAPDIGPQQGTSLRASYSKYIPSTLTNFLFAAYRHSTAHYYSLRDALQLLPAADGSVHSVPGRSREYASLTINQAIGASTSLALTSISQSYWDRPGHDRTFRLSVGRRIGRASVSLSLSRDLTVSGAAGSSRAMLTLDLPLDGESGWTANSQVTRDRQQGMSVQAGVSGSAGEDHRYGFNLNESRNSAGNSTSIGGIYRGALVTMSGSASRTPGSTQRSLNVDGGAVLHGGGVTFSNTLGDAVGLVHAPVAAGASVVGSPLSTVNADGYAVIPYLSPYNLNTVELDMQHASPDAQLDTTTELAVPRSGSVVLIDFKGRRGRSVLINARAEDGSALPFSATVTDESGRAVGLVGQGSRIEASVEGDSGRLLVRWGDDPGDQCLLVYQLPPAAESAGALFTRAEGVCRRATSEIYSESRASQAAQ
nr:fimbria/pilus outer membrane usher protein [Caenimonas aquaedulcis]